MATIIKCDICGIYIREYPRVTGSYYVQGCKTREVFNKIIIGQPNGDSYTPDMCEDCLRHALYRLGIEVEERE